jgi:hypothetical protein
MIFLKKEVWKNMSLLFVIGYESYVEPPLPPIRSQNKYHERLKIILELCSNICRNVTWRVFRKYHTTTEAVSYLCSDGLHLVGEVHLSYENHDTSNFWRSIFLKKYQK